MREQLEHITELLERLVVAVEEWSERTDRHAELSAAELQQRRDAVRSRWSKHKAVPKTQPTLPTVATGRQPGKVMAGLIAFYIEKWQLRYKTKARPEVTKAIGVFRALLKERGYAEICNLLEVYLQMEDPWFMVKKHDIVTFRENVGKVALALDKGYEEGATGEKPWQQIYAERLAEQQKKSDSSMRIEPTDEESEDDGAGVSEGHLEASDPVAQDLQRREARAVLERIKNGRGA